MQRILLLLLSWATACAFLPQPILGQAPPVVAAPATNADTRTNLELPRLLRFGPGTNTLPATLPSPGFPAAPGSAPNTNLAPTLTQPATQTNLVQPFAQQIPLPAPGGNPVVSTNLTASSLAAPGATNLPPGTASVPTRTGANTPNVITLPDNAAAAPGAVGVVDRSVLNDAEMEEVLAAGTIQIQGMELPQFLELYAEISRRTVLRSYQLPAPAGLTLKAQTDLTRREALEAMDGVLALNGITMINSGRKFVKAVPSNTAVQEGAAISELTAAELPDSEQWITRIVKLKTAKPTEIAPLFASFTKNPAAITPIDSNQTIILRDYSSNVKRMLEIIERVDVLPESDFKLEVVPIKYGKVAEIYDTMNALISGSGGGGSFAGAGAPRSSTTGGRGRGNVNQPGQFGNQSLNRVNQPGMGGQYNPQQMAQQQQPGVAAGQSSFQGRLNQIISRAATGEQIQVLENANIVPDERSNRLLIFANKRDMEMITNIVAKVDVLLAQVLIEAIIMEVSTEDSKNIGVSMVQQPKRFGADFTGAGGANNGQPLLSSITNFGSGLPSGFSYFGKIGDTLDVAVTAIARDSRANVISRPRIQTSHAIPGFFFIGETVPYITGISDYGAYGGGFGGGLGTRSQISQAQVGFTLDVTPYITPEGYVVMEIGQTFDTRGADVLIDGNPVPIINNRTANAVLTVRDGDTIMMGGFISDSKSKSKSGVPVLKDIPVLGALFRSKNNSSDRTELIVLMRATVLDSPADAALMAASERASLPGIYDAEQQQKAEDKDRLRKAKNRSPK